jgi:hypothetical protein
MGKEDTLSSELVISSHCPENAFIGYKISEATYIL